MLKSASAAAVSIVAAASYFAGVPAPAQASPTCYGTKCIGKDPSRTSCVKDAKVIGRMDIHGDSILELRWSRSCNASWGRFSTYWRGDLANGEKTGISYARLTAWNPGNKKSQHVVGQVLGIGSTWWTAMVTGTTRSCTGVELISKSGGGQGWHWGPCVD